MRSFRQTWAPLLAGALAVSALSACGTENDAEFEDPAGQSQQDGGSEPDGGSDPAAEDDGDADDTDADDDGQGTGGRNPGSTTGTADPDDAGPAAPVENPGPQDALQTVSYDLPDSEDGTVTVGLHGLRIQDNVMVLELTFTPEGVTEPYNVHAMAGNRVIRPQLHDRENLKQYSILGSPNGWATDVAGRSPGVESGESLQYWAYYALPEDDIDTVAVQVLDGLAMFDEVAIER